MDLDAYFRRIGYTGKRAPTAAVLAAIARLHPMAIAFENIAVAAGGVPETALPAVFAKLVASGRGGYCYEHNTLLKAALEALGFRVTILAARVRYRLPPDLVTARGHMTLLVETEAGPMLADAGFGGLTLTAPVALRPEAAQPTPHETVRLVEAEGDYLLQAQLGADWVDVYRFDLSRQLASDIEQMNWFTATRPGAMFAHNVIATRPVPGGRYALFNRTLSFRAPGQPAQRRVVNGAAALGEVLRGIFGLALPPAEIARAAEKAASQPAENPSFS